MMDESIRPREPMVCPYCNTPMTWTRDVAAEEKLAVVDVHAGRFVVEGTTCATPGCKGNAAEPKSAGPRQPYHCLGCGIEIEQGERCDGCEILRLRMEIEKANKRQLVLQREHRCMEGLLRRLVDLSLLDSTHVAKVMNEAHALLAEFDAEKAADRG